MMLNNNLKRILSYALAIMVLIVTLLSDISSGIDNNAYVDAKNKTVKKNVFLYKGQSYKLKLKSYSFNSSNKKIVTVTKKGKIKAKKTGKAKITAKALNSNKKRIYNVKVGKYISSLKIDNATTIVLKIGSTSTLKTTISPSGVLYKGLTYISDNNAVATVDSNGVITGISKGTTIIKATSKAINKKKKQITAAVTVVVIGEAATPSPDEPGDLIDDLGDYTIIVPINSAEPTGSTETTASPVVEPTEIPTNEPVPSEKPTVSPEPMQTAIPTDMPAQTPTAAPTDTPEPTATPELTASPTPVATQVPMTIREYAATLTADPNNPVAGKFLLASNNNSYRTVYFINKNYIGKVRLQVKDYVYSKDINAYDLMKKIQDETGSMTNSAGTVTATKLAKKGKWTIEFLQTGEKYYIQGTITDTAYKTEFGLIVADGNTLDIINIIPE